MAGEKQPVVIAEDDMILREGLRALIFSDPDFNVVAEAGTAMRPSNSSRSSNPVWY
jgi:DNA-binding NarL/FixJ family response regulator